MDYNLIEYHSSIFDTKAGDTRMRAYRKVKTWLRHQKGLFAILHPLHRAWRRGIMRFYQRTRGIDPMKVTFSSFMGESYSDNPRYISERLHELCPEAKIVWLFRSERMNAVKVPDYVRKVALLSRAGLREEATARFWVDNFRRGESGYLNDKKQFYINTWHGDRGFKKVGDDNEKLPFAMYRLEDRCAMMIAGSEFGRNT